MSADNAMVILVTGASSGIGAACATLLAERGHRVFGASRRAAAEDPGGRIELLQMDVTDEASVGRGVGHIIDKQGRIDVVVNNAGFGLAGAIEDTSLAEARRQLETNFFGVFNVCKAVLPGMRARREGLIINVSSLGGVIGLPFQGLYSASKFAVEGLTESLRQEVKRFGIRATLIQPGDVCTSITDNRVKTEGSRSSSAYKENFDAALQIIEKEERRGVPAALVASLVLRLLKVRSPRVRYTIGHLSQRSSVLAKAVLPSNVFEKSMMSYYGL